MSYSRWMTSTFYTYWCVSDAKNKNDEVFMCHTDIYKSYKFKYIECKRIVEDLTSIKGKINEIEGDEERMMSTPNITEQKLRKLIRDEFKKIS